MRFILASSERWHGAGGCLMGVHSFAGRVAVDSCMVSLTNTGGRVFPIHMLEYCFIFLHWKKAMQVDVQTERPRIYQRGVGRE